MDLSGASFNDILPGHDAPAKVGALPSVGGCGCVCVCCEKGVEETMQRRGCLHTHLHPRCTDIYVCVVSHCEPKWTVENIGCRGCASGCWDLK